MIRRARAAVARTTLEPLLVRVGVFAAGLAGLLVAAPSGLPPAVLAALAGSAALPALAPRGPFVTLLVLAAVTGWLLDTGVSVIAGTGAGGQVPQPGRLLLLAGLLYLVHTLAALAAALPHDAVVSPEVPTRWLGRALGVILAATVLSILVLAGLGEFATGQTYPVVALGGVVVAVAMSTLLRGRRHTAPDHSGAADRGRMEE